MANSDYDKKQGQHGGQKQSGAEHSGQKQGSSEKQHDQGMRPGGSQGGQQKSGNR
jgi:hypothetical protein